MTGGAGFIGSAVVRRLMNDADVNVLTIDKLTYAGNLANLREVTDGRRHQFLQADIADQIKMTEALKTFKPTAILHLAAESHVDRSISGSADFIATNIVGTHVLLETASDYYAELSEGDKKQFRFVHVSTDEVYGSLEPDDPAFDESSSYRPNSPYSASKAAADHLVRAWWKTYRFPVITTNCSNNYGPYQFPEKLIPLMIMNALNGKMLPVYGAGDQIRDWLYVDDHASALLQVMRQGRPGEEYCISGDCERVNLEIVHEICDILDEINPDSPHAPHRNLIRHVEDRPGHDKRYALNASKLRDETGWAPKENFSRGLRKTVEWYMKNQDWCRTVQRENDMETV